MNEDSSDEEALGSVRKLFASPEAESSQGQTCAISDMPSPALSKLINKSTETPISPTARYFATIYFWGMECQVPITAEINTGSSAMMVTEVMYAEHFSHIPLKLQSKVLHNFNESPVQGICGSFRIDTFYGDKQQHVWVYANGNTASSVFSCNLIHPFELVKVAQFPEGSSPEQVWRVDGYPRVIAEKFLSLMSDKLSCFPGFEHSLTIMENTKPMTQKMQPVPF